MNINLNEIDTDANYDIAVKAEYAEGGKILLKRNFIFRVDELKSTTPEERKKEIAQLLEDSKPVIDPEEQEKITEVDAVITELKKITHIELLDVETKK